MSLELMTVGGSMLAAIYGPGLALRGPDGSMHRAVDGLLLEYKLAFLFFCSGIGLFCVAAFIFALIEFNWVLSLPMAGGMLYFMYDLRLYFKHIYDRFALSETVSGKFDFDSPAPTAASSAVAASGGGGGSSSSSKAPAAPAGAIASERRVGAYRLGDGPAGATSTRGAVT